MAYYYKHCNGEAFSLAMPNNRDTSRQIVSFRSLIWFVKKLKRLGYFNRGN